MLPDVRRDRKAQTHGPLGPGRRWRFDCSTFTIVTLEELAEAVALGAVDTVLLAMTDMQGRLQGKRLMATHFLEEVAEHGAESCNYLLAVDVDMRTVDGYAMSSWERGYGDMLLVPDLDTLRPVPWQEGTVVCLSDVAWPDGSDVVASPRQILRRQLARLAERGWSANAGTELEFMVFLDSYEQAWHKGYSDLTPANLYNVDYSLLGTARVEPLIRRIRNSMAAAGMVVEDSKGECNFGQHEINFRYADALRTADEHAIYKNGAKEIAAAEGMAITFMAKYDEREGSSCHIHFSLADASDPSTPLFAREEAIFHSFLAGQLACLREMTLLLAPHINSYKRYTATSFAPTAVAWGHDNRTCSLRVVGHGPSLRFENRVGGADLNPYLALSAIVASGLHGLDAGLELEPPLEGNAYAAAEREHLPATLRDARELFASSAVAREAFGEDVVAHYLNAADVELASFQAAVTDWERVRGFERL
jgi:glutamine synthetase